MVTVERWTGRQARALRLARRMSLAGFAGHLGVSVRAVSKWEARGEECEPVAVNQAALDTSLQKADPHERERFAASVSIEDATSASPSLIRHPVDGKLMALVEAGEFLAGPCRESVWLAGFYMDVYPTTNADYARFIAATGHPAPAHWTDGRIAPHLADHPAVFVTWRDAANYAAWAGKALPDAAQWEKAARGAKGSAYPWGDAATPAKCNVRENGVGATTPVDRYHSGVSVYGVYDLCGNVWEWCATATTPGRRELKGSAFTSLFSRALPSLSNDADEMMRDDNTGFRCVCPTGLPGIGA